MFISLLRSRSGLRLYIFRGLIISVLFILTAFLGNVWQVYSSGNQVLSKNEHADAAVVLGAAAWNKQPSPVFRERINHAITLYQSGRVNKIIFTGGTPKKGYMTEAEVGRRYAIKQGVATKNILFENTSRNTYENLYNIKPLLRANNINSIIIVSDPYHLARAAAMAQDLGLDAKISATPTTLFNQNREKERFILQESYLLLMYQCESWGDKVWRMVTRNT